MTILIKRDDIPTGVRLSIDNAKDLLKEAEILYGKARYARSTALFILALEEIAKATFLRDRWSNGMDITAPFWSKKIIKHLPKARRGVSLSVEELASRLRGKVNKKTLNTLSLSLSSIATNYEAIREGCIYVNWDKGQWIDPNSGKYAQELVKPITLNPEHTMEALASITLHHAKFALENFENHRDSQKILSIT